MEDPMTDQERNQVLKMIEDGKISPEEGLKLMQALEQNPADDERTPSRQKAHTQEEGAGPDRDPRLSNLKSSVQRLWQIPLWIGLIITVFSALGM
jgi:hypothetical protein